MEVARFISSVSPDIPRGTLTRTISRLSDLGENADQSSRDRAGGQFVTSTQATCRARPESTASATRTPLVAQGMLSVPFTERGTCPCGTESGSPQIPGTVSPGTECSRPLVKNCYSG
jgi:hypothetical protein